MPDVQTHYRTCHLCEAMCGLKIEVTDNQVTAIRGNDHDVLSRGHLCPKATALADLHSDPDRLRTPVRRDGDAWVPVSWDEAFELVADKLLGIRARYGADALATYAGNPNVHNYSSLTHGGQVVGHLKTRNRFSASSIDQLPHQLIALWMYGHKFLVPIPDLDHTTYLFMLGANPLASNGSLMTAPDIRARLKAIQKRGGKIVVLDPRRTETGELADEFHFIRPGSDAALLAAMLNVIFDEGLNVIQPDYINQLDEAVATLAPFTPERAATVTGIDADTIRRLAREAASAPKAIFYGRMGLSTQEFGGLCQWLLQLLNIATGNLDQPGGVMFTLPAVDMVGAPGSKAGHFGNFKSRVTGLPEFCNELPVGAMIEEMTTPGEGQIKALLTIAGNPVLSTPNGPELEKALGGLEFMVSVDFYINETTRFADVILPPTGPLEHDHYDLVFHIFAIRNTVKYHPPLFPKAEDALDDWEIFERLGKVVAAKMGVEPKAGPSPQQVIDLGLQLGPYGAKAGSPHALSLPKLLEHPHGIDLGPLQPMLPARLKTPSGKVECAPQPLLKDVARAKSRLLDTPPHKGLVLIGRRHLRSNNSWMHNSERLVKGKDRCVLLMHPNDLADHALTDGQQVRVTSRVGELDIAVSASDAVRPGVVCMPHGWGHHRPGVQLTVAGQHPGVSINDITDPALLDDLSGNAAVNGTPVTVAAI